MPQDPLGFFKVGQEIGKSNESAFGGLATNVMDEFRTRQKHEFEREGKLEDSKALKKYELELEEESAKRVMGGESNSSDFVPSEFKIGNVSYKNPKYQEEIKKLQTEAMVEREMNKRQALGGGAESGKLTLANESIKNIQDMKRLLFPDGTPESFKRQSAFSMKPWPFNKPIPNSYEGQTLYRKGGASIAGRQLIQTGVAAREEEHAQLMDQFLANAFSNPKSAFESLDELESFYSNYGKIADPQSFFTNRADTAKDASTTSNKSITREDALAELRRRGHKV